MPTSRSRRSNHGGWRRRAATSPPGPGRPNGSGARRRRVRARALIALASTLVRRPWQNAVEAKHCLEKAKELIDDLEDRDYLVREFQDSNNDLAAATTEKRRVLELTLSEILLNGLERTLNEVERKIVETVYRDVGGTSISGTAQVLQTTRNRVKRILTKRS